MVLKWKKLQAVGKRKSISSEKHSAATSAAADGLGKILSRTEK
jgi:hypothetical protein